MVTNMKIHKYYINGPGLNKIDCYPGKWISTGLDGDGNLVIWREEKGSPDDAYTIIEFVYMIFTGHEPPGGDYHHLGTVTQGSLVCHIYVW